MTIPPDLLVAAQNAHQNAYSPYSKYRVGAAIRLASSEIFAGCNVENASYGATICAERGAVLSAIAAIGAIKITEIVVLSDGNPPWPPCGMCRQVIAEFAAPNCLIWCVNEAGTVIFQNFETLFPLAFDAEFLDS